MTDLASPPYFMGEDLLYQNMKEFKMLIIL